MAPSSLLSILSLALVSILSVSVAPANALSIHQTSHDHAVRAHAAISARRDVLSKRSNSRRCNKSKATSTAKPAPTTTKQTQAQTSASQPNKSSGSTDNNKSGGNSGGSSGSSSSGNSNSGSSNSGSSNSGSSNSGSNSGSSNSGSSNSGSSASKPPPSNGGGVFDFGSKAGLAWPNGDANNLAAWKGGKTRFIYTWSPWKPDSVDDSFVFAPMLWGWNQLSDFQSKVVEGYAKIALGMNECNEVGQSNMDPYSAVSLWRQAMLPLASKGYTLVSPAMSSRPNGKDWMKTFMDNCKDCQVSAIAIHWYGTSLDDFKNFITYWHDTYNLPVLITEYADQNFSGGAQATQDEVWSFMVGATQWINSQDWIKAHCWFGAMEQMQGVNTFNKLMNDAGNAPNDLGYYFINN